MNTEFFTMYQDAGAKAFFVLTPQGKRLAVFPYGEGADDVPEKQARKHAWRFLNFTNKQPDKEKQEEKPSICLQCARFGNLCKVGMVGLSWCKHFTARDAEQHTVDSEVGLDLDRAWMESMRKDEKGGQGE